MSESVGLAKSVESVEPSKPIVHNDLPPVSVSQNPEAPYDVYALFNTDPFKTEEADKAKLLEIYQYASSKVPENYRTLGNIMMKISELNNSLGAPSIDERSFTKLHTFVKLSRIIDDFDKQRQALRN